MIPLYSPGTSALHRAPAGAKLVALVAVGLAVSIWRDSAWVAAGAWAMVLCGYMLAFRRWRGAAELLRRLWALKWLALLIAVPQLIFVPAPEAVITSARILAVVMLAGLFTLTTRVTAVMELVLLGFRPVERLGFGRLGLTAERVALAMSLTMTAIPTVFGFYGDIREARRARGAKQGPGAVVSTTTALLVMTLKHAEETAEALVARGVR